jgi:hypothetical protein
MIFIIIRQSAIKAVRVMAREMNRQDIMRRMSARRHCKKRRSPVQLYAICAATSISVIFCLTWSVTIGLWWCFRFHSWSPPRELSGSLRVLLFVFFSVSRLYFRFQSLESSSSCAVMSSIRYPTVERIAGGTRLDAF